MNKTQKERIDRMSYEQMLRIWSFSPCGNPIFPEDYFNTSMDRKKYEILRDTEGTAGSATLRCENPAD